MMNETMTEEDDSMHTSGSSPAILSETEGQLTPRVSVPDHQNKDLSTAPDKMRVENLDFYYGRSRALKNISLSVAPNHVTAFIGPSGCGKSTLIRTLNRMNDVIPGTRVEGVIELDGEDIYSAGTDVVTLRRKVGMVFQKSNPFPRSIFDNVAYGLKVNRMTRS